MTEIKNAVLGSVKKPYEKPEIEAINLDNQAPLLAGSYTGGAGTQGLVEGGEWPGN